MSGSHKIVALCGGVGGAKLALGLEHVFGSSVTLIVNTGDDFEHLGLHVSPDLDTVVYTLAAISDIERGWGRAEETWSFLESLGELGGQTWFRLGDRDLAMHVERTHRLRSGVSLSAFTAGVAKKLKIKANIVPMSDDPVSTIVHTDEGALHFQDYFVRRKCEPRFRHVEFAHAEQARPAEAALAALQDPELKAILVCPSNPFLSIDPILAIPALRRAIVDSGAPIVVVSPLVGGQAVKGPTAKILSELKLDCLPLTIARHYDGLLDGLIIDHQDTPSSGFPVPTHKTATLMQTLQDRMRLAVECIEFADLIQVQKSQASAV